MTGIQQTISQRPLSEKERDDIRELMAEGWTPEEIKEHLGMDKLPRVKPKKVIDTYDALTLE